MTRRRQAGCVFEHIRRTAPIIARPELVSSRFSSSAPPAAPPHPSVFTPGRSATSTTSRQTPHDGTSGGVSAHPPAPVIVSLIWLALVGVLTTTLVVHFASCSSNCDIFVLASLFSPCLQFTAAGSRRSLTMQAEPSRSSGGAAGVGSH